LTGKIDIIIVPGLPVDYLKMEDIILISLELAIILTED